MKISMSLAGLVAAGALSSTVARAAPGNGRTIVRFDGDTIDGDLMRPDGDLFSARQDISMPSLVEAPRSFDREARRTLLMAAAALDDRPQGLGGRNGGR